MGRGGLLRSWVSRNLPIPLPQGGDDAVSQGCHGLAEPEAVDDTHMRRWRKMLRGAADKYATFDPISRRLCHGKDVCDRVHGTGISAAYVLGPLGFQQHQVPSTRPEKINFTVLLIAIKKTARPGGDRAAGTCAIRRRQKIPRWLPQKDWYQYCQDGPPAGSTADQGPGNRVWVTSPGVCRHSQKRVQATPPGCWPGGQIAMPQSWVVTRPHHGLYPICSAAARCGRRRRGGSAQSPGGCQC
jgi:hypothetical protein